MICARNNGSLESYPTKPLDPAADPVAGAIGVERSELWPDSEGCPDDAADDDADAGSPDCVGLCTAVLCGWICVAVSVATEGEERGCCDLWMCCATTVGCVCAVCGASPVP